jgi:antitoxin (DNA-binding transcriptional repressor) of toxin-antitoxin stability system
MSSISVQEIQSNPSGFLRRIEAGESLLVVRGQEPVAEIRSLCVSPNGQRPFGLCAGQFSVPPDFDDPLPADVMRDFDGQ